MRSGNQSLSLIERIERALLIAARCIELDGPVHLPAYERLERELDAMVRTEDSGAGPAPPCSEQTSAGRDRSEIENKMMKIEFPYEFTKIDDVRAGSFFAAHEDGQLAFFMLVSRNGAQENDLVAFTLAPRPDNVLPAMTSTSFLRGGPVAVIRDAVVRPDFQELLQGNDRPPIGSITFQPGKTFLWASSPNRMARSAVDLSLGSYTDAQQLDAFTYVKRWEVGFVRDEKFTSLFRFNCVPLAASLDKAV